MDPRYQRVLVPYQRPPGALMPDYGADDGRHVRRVRRRGRRHDGLYLRLAGGLGTAAGSTASDRPLPFVSGEPDVGPPLEGGVSGLAAVTELAVGATPWRGLVLGVGVFTATLPSPTVTGEASPMMEAYRFAVTQLALVSPVVDYYIDPDLGFHVQAGFGFASYIVGAGEAAGAPRARPHVAAGIGAMLGAGYEWWVADEWSLGLLARLLYGRTGGTDPAAVEWRHRTLAPAALVTATYH